MTVLLLAISSILSSVPAEAAEDGSIRNIRVECRSRIEDGNEYSAQILGKVKAKSTSSRDSFDASGNLRVQLLQNDLVVFDRRLEVVGGYSTAGRTQLLNVSAEVGEDTMHIAADLRSTEQVLSEIQFKDKIFPMDCSK